MEISKLRVDKDGLKALVEYVSGATIKDGASRYDAFSLEALPVVVDEERSGRAIESGLYVGGYEVTIRTLRSPSEEEFSDLVDLVKKLYKGLLPS